MFLFRVGLLTLMNMASLMVLAILFSSLPKIFHHQTASGHRTTMDNFKILGTVGPRLRQPILIWMAKGKYTYLKQFELEVSHISSDAGKVKIRENWQGREGLHLIHILTKR